MDEVDCPYCGETFEINHDDGAHYRDGESEVDTCSNCDKQIMISASCCWSYEAEKADCLNDMVDHDWTKWYKLWVGEEEHEAQKLERRSCNACGKNQQEWHKIDE